MIDLNKIPDNPGVYLMKDKLDNIIYIGKAKNLNKRVKQYFDKNAVEKRGQKIIKMVSLINDIDFIITNTEVEALILENNLIKENLPKYNTLLKDDKTYPYIKITLNEEYPRLLITRKIEKDKSKYFGPFTDITALNKVIDLLKDIYKIRCCDYTKLPNKSCLYYQMNKCIAPCINECKEQYLKNIDNIIEIFTKDNKSICDFLKEKMNIHSEKMEYEDAAKYRDLLNCINKITLKQNINNKLDSQDVIAYELIDEKIIIIIFFIRNGKLVNREIYYLEKIDNDLNILSEFIQQYYNNITYFPNEIIIGENINDLTVLQEWITQKSKTTKIVVPQKGHKNDLLKLAQKNIKLIISEDVQKIKNKEKKNLEEINEIKEIVGKENITRIEAYDISNTSGVLNVASMIVWENENFKKNSYRKFKLNVLGANDYLCMQETIRRRFTDENLNVFPDLILIDGGKGQVNAVLQVLNELNINICVCGMVKNDKHQTRGLYFNNKEYDIKKSINLITRIQDETHNFAINYHTLLRTKEMLHSVLDDIYGIGNKKKNELLKHFGSIENISNASKEDLSKLKVLNKKDIDNIYNFFQNKRT